MRWTGGVGLLLLLPVLAGQEQQRQGQEYKEGNRKGEARNKGGTRQRAKADPPLEKEGWGVSRPETERPHPSRASRPGIAT